jgi:hypothetical protein
MKEYTMSDTYKREKHTRHRAKTEYSKSGIVKVQAVGRIKQGHGSFICPCCIHMGNDRRCFSHIKTISRRMLRHINKNNLMKETSND